MSKELGFNGKIDFGHHDNCLIGVVHAAFDLLYPDLKLNLRLTKKALAEKNYHYLSNFLQLIRELPNISLKHDILEFSNDPDELYCRLTTALEGGAVCHLSVHSSIYINLVRGINRYVKPDAYHSLLVYGFYQPTRDLSDRWLYIADSYDNSQRLINWQDLYPALETVGPWVHTCIIGLELDPTDLTKDFHCTDRYLNLETQQKIRGSLSGLFGGPISAIVTPKTAHV